MQWNSSYSLKRKAIFITLNFLSLSLLYCTISCTIHSTGTLNILSFKFFQCCMYVNNMDLHVSKLLDCLLVNNNYAWSFMLWAYLILSNPSDTVFHSVNLLVQNYMIFILYMSVISSTAPQYLTNGHGTMYI